LTFFIEDEIATGFFRNINAEAEHNGFSFLWGNGFKQVASLRGSNSYSLGDKWSLGVN
jgi:hypothetical protein